MDAEVKRFLDQIWHRLRGYEWLSSEQVNSETGTCDDYCTCRFCKRKT